MILEFQPPERRNSKLLSLRPPSLQSFVTAAPACWRIRIIPAYLIFSKFVYFKELINFFFCSLGLHLQHMEVPRLEVKMEQQRRSTPQPPQRRILNPLMEARDRIRILVDTR